MSENNNYSFLNFEKKISLISFKKLLNVFSQASVFLDDVDIVNGRIRQLTADKTIFLEIDLGEEFRDLSLIIVNLKNKIKLFKLILRDGENIKISSNEKEWILESEKTKFIFAQAVRDVLNTSYISDEKFELLGKYFLETPFLIISPEESFEYIKKIKSIVEVFKIVKVIFKIDKYFELYIESLDKRNKAVVFKIENKMKLEKNNILLKTEFLEGIESSNLENVVLKFYPIVGEKSLIECLFKISETENICRLLFFGKREA